MIVEFSPFRLDLEQGRLWRGSDPVELTPRAWAALVYLAQRPGRLVAKEELLYHAWQGVAVSAKRANNVIGELRAVLGDAPTSSRYIETVRGRGFRFLGATAGAPSSETGATAAIEAPLGREESCATLRALWDEVVRVGQRRTVFVSGDIGVGKSTLLDALARSLPTESAWVLRGECCEHHGQPEPFQALVDAFTTLCRRTPQASEYLSRLAPEWLVQLPEYAGTQPRDSDPSHPSGRGSGRLLRQLDHAIEGLARTRPVFLLLEDLHWADVATIDAVSRLASRQNALPLLIAASFRPPIEGSESDALSEVRRQLVLRQRAQEIELGGLDRAGVSALLAGRGMRSIAPDLTDWLLARTDGNPLFIAIVLDDLRSRGLLRGSGSEWSLGAEFTSAPMAAALSETARLRIARLADEHRELLAAASVVGRDFSTDLVAAMLGESQAAVEAMCSDIASATGLIATRFDATGTADTDSYRFAHSLYPECIYADIPASLRRSLHLKCAEALRRRGPAGSAEAGRIGQHFARAGEPEQAFEAYEAAVDAAVRQHAHVAAAQWAAAALAVAERLEPSAERDSRALRLALVFGTSSTGIDVGAPQVVQTFRHALGLADRMQLDSAKFLALAGLCIATGTSRGAIDDARTYSTGLSELARSGRLGPAATVAAEAFRGQLLLHRGEFLAARACLEAIATGPVDLHELDEAGGAWVDIHVFTLAHLAAAHSALGELATAATTFDRAAERARAGDDTYSLVFVTYMRWIAAFTLGHLEEARSHAECGRALASEAGLNGFEAQADLVLAATAALQGDDATLEEWQAVQRDLERRHYRIAMSMYYVALAQAFKDRGAFERAEQSLEAAAAQVDRGERFAEAELYRCRGELLLAQTRAIHESAPSRSTRRKPKESAIRTQAEEAFTKALAIARQRETRGVLELRAALSLATLWHADGRTREARDLLAESCARIPPGGATPLRDDAEALCHEWAPARAQRAPAR